MFTSHIPLHQFTTLQVGGVAEYFFEASDEASLQAACQKAKAAKLPVTILGGGSNVLIADEGLSGVTIKLAIRSWHEKLEGETLLLTVGAGENFDSVIEKAVNRGYRGLENLSHIPGSVGATPVQNVGAYGVEVADVIRSVRVYDRASDTFRTLLAADCQFGYRDSIFKQPEGKEYVVTAVTFALSQTSGANISYRDLATQFAANPNPTPAEVRAAVIAIRGKKFPDWTKVGTAGSFFKNPIIAESHYQRLVGEYAELPGFPVGNEQIKVPLGWILDRVCQVRGVEQGKVGTYQGQALVIINTGGATASEITQFAESLQKSVKEKTDIDVEWEVTKLG